MDLVTRYAWSRHHYLIKIEYLTSGVEEVRHNATRGVMFIDEQIKGNSVGQKKERGERERRVVCAKRRKKASPETMGRTDRH